MFLVLGSWFLAFGAWAAAQDDSAPIRARTSSSEEDGQMWAIVGLTVAGVLVGVVLYRAALRARENARSWLFPGLLVAAFPFVFFSTTRIVTSAALMTASALLALSGDAQG
ncbi:hypothetical protein ACMYYO_08105 [Dermacoccaceae bacterium W4C1]